VVLDLLRNAYVHIASCMGLPVCREMI
jgi:hypothetical protein